MGTDNDRSDAISVYNIQENNVHGGYREAHDHYDPIRTDCKLNKDEAKMRIFCAICQKIRIFSCVFRQKIVKWYWRF